MPLQSRKQPSWHKGRITSLCFHSGISRLSERIFLVLSEILSFGYSNRKRKLLLIYSIEINDKGREKIREVSVLYPMCRFTEKFISHHEPELQIPMWGDAFNSFEIYQTEESWHLSWGGKTLVFIFLLH